MPFNDALVLYSEIVLPRRLAEGPKTLEHLDVPPYTLKHPQAHGQLAPKMYRIGSIAEQVWFRREDYELLRLAGMLTPRRHCWELTDEDFGRRAGAVPL
jgi:hypothetical protein